MADAKVWCQATGFTIALMSHNCLNEGRLLGRRRSGGSPSIRLSSLFARARHSDVGVGVSRSACVLMGQRLEQPVNDNEMHILQHLHVGRVDT